VTEPGGANPELLGSGSVANPGPSEESDPAIVTGGLAGNAGATRITGGTTSGTGGLTGAA
jgi:hypothetical protein